MRALFEEALPWHVVQTEPSAEFMAHRGIGSLQDIRSFLPTEVVHRRKMRGNRPVISNGRFVEEPVQRPYFRGYLLAQFDAATAAWGAILRTEGVKRLLCMVPGRPTPVREGVVEDLMALGRAGDGAIDQRAPVFPRLSEGQKVRLPASPFSDIEAVVQWTDQERVTVLLGTLTMKVRRAQVEVV